MTGCNNFVWYKASSIRGGWSRFGEKSRIIISRQLKSAGAWFDFAGNWLGCYPPTTSCCPVYFSMTGWTGVQHFAESFSLWSVNLDPSFLSISCYFARTREEKLCETRKWNFVKDILQPTWKPKQYAIVVSPSVLISDGILMRITQHPPKDKVITLNLFVCFIINYVPWWSNLMGLRRLSNPFFLMIKQTAGELEKLTNEIKGFCSRYDRNL